MQKLIEKILTDKTARSIEVISAIVLSSTAVTAPWAE